MTFIESEQDDAQGPEGFRKELKRLKNENKELRQQADELAQLKRERTFVQAGVPLDDKRAAYFIAGYQGDNSPEAIKAEWQATFGGQHQSEGHGQEQNPQVSEELALLNRISETTSGGSTIPPDRLAERDQKLASLSPTDPRFAEKFNVIFDEYGGQRGVDGRLRPERN